MLLCTVRMGCVSSPLRGLGFELHGQTSGFKCTSDSTALLTQRKAAQHRLTWRACTRRSPFVRKTQCKGLNGSPDWCRRRHTTNVTLFLSFMKNGRRSCTTVHKAVPCATLSTTSERTTCEKAEKVADLKEALITTEDRILKQKFMTRWSATRFTSLPSLPI